MIKALTAKVDVMVENFAPGVMKRMGLCYEDLKAINPAPRHVLDLARGTDRPAQRQTWISTIRARPMPASLGLSASPTADRRNS